MIRNPRILDDQIPVFHFQKFRMSVIQDLNSGFFQFAFRIDLLHIGDRDRMMMTCQQIRRLRPAAGRADD